MNNNESGKTAVFFISTGRCGTQFFADKLFEHYGDLAHVDHEPFQMEYKPAHYFSAYHSNKKINLSPAIERHLAFIDDTLEDSNYIETGWPVYGLLPYIISHFKGRLRIVHLYRHPMKVAASLTTHDVYSRGEWSEAMSISPAARGVAQNYLTEKKWNRMSEFEKSLFWWTEINHFALQLHKQFPSIPWLSLRFEDVFSGSNRTGLMKLASFLGFPKRAEFADSTKDKTDRYSYKTRKVLDISSISNYPVTTSVMEQLGYSYSESIMHDIHSRYRMSLIEKLQNRVRKIYRSLNKNFCYLISIFSKNTVD